MAVFTHLRVASLTIAGAALLAGCDPSAKTFGKNYDECLLKNAAQAAATEICARHFERLRTFEERDSDMLTAGGYIDEGVSKIFATVTNNSPDKIAISYKIVATFWIDEQHIPQDMLQRTIGPIQYGNPYSQSYHREMIQPGQTITVELPMPENAQLYGAFTVDASIQQVVPMKGK